MDSTEIERRKYPRFNAEVPVDIGLIDQKTGKPPKAQFKGVARDISMEGLRLELHYPAPNIHSFAPKLMGKKKEVDLGVNVNLKTKELRAVG